MIKNNQEILLGVIVKTDKIYLESFLGVNFNIYLISLNFYNTILTYQVVIKSYQF